MPDITVSYEGNTIATMSASGTKTFYTAGKYCDDDITLTYVQPSGGGGALYPLVNGSHTFSDGSTVTVTNGSHVVITVDDSSSSNGWVDFSNIAENTTNYHTADNVKNHSSKFTVPSNSVAYYIIGSLTSSNNSPCSFNVFGTGTSNLQMEMTNRTSGTSMASKTFTSATDVGCLFFVCPYPGTYEFDVAFIVDAIDYV